jgi:hypothetical protein
MPTACVKLALSIIILVVRHGAASVSGGVALPSLTPALDGGECSSRLSILASKGEGHPLPFEQEIAFPGAGLGRNRKENKLLSTQGI